jgi:hypothetical protein
MLSLPSITSGGKDKPEIFTSAGGTSLPPIPGDEAYTEPSETNYEYAYLFIVFVLVAVIWRAYKGNKD